VARPSSTDRLVRLLALPAWVAEHDGATFAQAAAHFGVTPQTIRADVDTLWVSGLPGGMPDDLVDFSATDFEAGRLSLTQPLGLDRPVRLSRREAVSLELSLGVLAEVLADDPEAVRTLTSTRRVLRRALGAADPAEDAGDSESSDSVSRASDPGDIRNTDLPAAVDAAEPGTPSATLRAVHRALAEQHRLHLVYVSATDERSERDVDPVRLVSDGTHLTLRAWCLSARAERSFRLDRILTATVLPIPASTHRTPRGARAATAAPEAVLTLRPTGRWLTEQIPCEQVRTAPDGSLHVRVRGRDRAWLAGLLLSAGRHLLAAEPADLMAQAGAAARRALALDAEVHAQPS